MCQCNTFIAKLSNSQPNTLKSGIKNGAEVAFNLSTNMISNDEISFMYKSLLPNTQVSRFHKAFANNSSANTKLPKTQLSKIGQPRGFLGRLLGLLIKTG